MMRQQALLTVLVVLLIAPSVPARGDRSGGIDWSAWQRLPVLQDGRLMPLDSFARAQVRKICGEVSPSLGKLGALTVAELNAKTADQIRQLAEAGKPRRFISAELLYGWVIEPDSWQDVPLLLAANEQLRSEVLGVPLLGEDGSKLKYASPRQVRASTKFIAKLQEMERKQTAAQKQKRKVEFSSLEDSIKDLDEALRLFEQLCYDPARRGDGHRWLMNDVAGMQESWLRLQEVLPRFPVFEPQPELFTLAQQSAESMRKFIAPWQQLSSEQEPVKNIEPVAAELRRATSEMAARLSDLAEAKLPPAAAMNKEQEEEIGSVRHIIARWTNNIATQAAQVHWGLYDAGEAICVVPALEATALEADRHRSEIHPWISLHALLQGSPNLLRGYPREGVDAVRSAWADARDVYLDRGATDRADRFSSAMVQFTSGVRSLAEAIEPQRQKLPIVERDKGLLAKTAYPLAFVTDAEVSYNRIDPFYWSWCASLSAACIMLLSFAFMRRQLFWLSAAVLVGAVLTLASGFGLRMYITHWAPVTSMFETIVWVAMCMAILTIWVTFLPLLGQTGKTAFGWTAIPGSWEVVRRPQDAVLPPVGPPQESTAGIRTLALGMRLALFLVGLYIMGVFQPMGVGGDYRLASLLPRIDIGSTLPNVSSFLVWVASMFVACSFVWYLPRLIPSALMAIPMSLALASRDEAAERMEKIYRWRAVILFGALASFLAALAANKAPFPRDIQALMPVLRSNFWLGIHVLTITTSYAGAATGWMIANVALGCYVFGRYRSVSIDENAASTVEGPRRPPAFCGTLASLNYRVIQVTVLLLTAGTILGGLWADVSWGRFWGWDPKEVGALIALLIIMTALHGRRAGWPGDLSLAIGAIFGFAGVLWAWYVVNFLLNAGKHSYGAGEGGQWFWLVAVLSGQLAFIGLAVARVISETRRTEA